MSTFFQLLMLMLWMVMVAIMMVVKTETLYVQFPNPKIAFAVMFRMQTCVLYVYPQESFESIGCGELSALEECKKSENGCALAESLVTHFKMSCTFHF